MDTGSELNKPLGQDRRKSRQNSRPRNSTRSWAALLALVVIVGSAGFIAMQQNPLRQPESQPPANPENQQQTAETLPVVIEGGEVDNSRVSGRSGADIQRTLTDDGQVVTTVSPLEREGDGPVIISGANTVGQDPRFAHLPVPELLEQTEYGRLPVVGADGYRPLDAYARPWSGARGTRIAIVVGGLGLSQTGTQYAIATLPEEVTLAFAATGNSLQRWLQEARRGGHEVLLQVPFEPFNYPQTNPGPHTLLVDDGAQQNIADLHWAMGRITNYTGIMNFMGARFLSDQKATESVMRELSRRGVLFLDDGTSARTVTEPIAGAVGVPHAQADLVVDTNVGREDILKKLDEAERIARRNGSAIAIASAFDTSVDAIAAWANEAKARGIEIVAVSALADDPEDL